MSVRLRVLAALSAALLSSAVRAQDGRFRGLPSLVCADRRTSALCQVDTHTKKTTVTTRSAAPTPPPPDEGLPAVACEIPGAQGPCSKNVCGDKVCAFGEVGRCQADCPIPATVDVCRCEPTGCRAYRLSCDQSGCRSAAIDATGDACRCAATDGAQRCAAEAGKLCKVTRVSQPVSACELVRFNTGARRAYSRCTDQTCPPPSFGLVEEDFLPAIEKAAVDGPK